MYTKQCYLRGNPTTRQEKLKVLSEILSPFTDMMAKSFPGVGVGYYSRELDAIEKPIKQQVFSRPAKIHRRISQYLFKQPYLGIIIAIILLNFS